MQFSEYGETEYRMNLAALLCMFTINFSGGRNITVVGTGFDLVQRAVMRVLPSTDEFNLQPSNAEVILRFQKKMSKENF